MIGDTHAPLVLKRYKPQPQHITLDDMKRCPICGEPHGIINCPICHHRESSKV